MDAASGWFVAGYVFCAVQAGALLLVVSRSTGGDASAGPDEPGSQD